MSKNASSELPMSNYIFSQRHGEKTVKYPLFWVEILLGTKSCNNIWVSLGSFKNLSAKFYFIPMSNFSSVKVQQWCLSSTTHTNSLAKSGATKQEQQLCPLITREQALRHFM